jgi:hypothetical protein
MEIKADIIDYMGTYEGCIMVLISLMCEGEYSEATVLYHKDELMLTVQKSVEEKLGMVIEQWEGYRDLLESIFKKLVPADEMFSRLDPVDFDEFLSLDEEIYYVDEEVDEDELTLLDQQTLEFLYATQSNL